MPYAVRRKNLSHAAVTTSGGGGKPAKKKSQQKDTNKRVRNEVIIRSPLDDIRDAASGVVGKLSKYVGGFIRKGNRMNNSKAYNHDYYIHNKHKWKVKTPGKDSRQHIALYRLGSKWAWKTPEMPWTIKEKTEWEKYKEKYKDVLNHKNPFHKYLYKVKTLNGKFRYFYSYAQYARFLVDMPQKTRSYTIQEDMSEVNKMYSNMPGADKNYTHNCGFCSIAYDLRRRGYDVQAIASMDGIGSVSNLYAPPKGETLKRRDSKLDTTEDKTSKEYTADLFKALAQTGDDASGEVGVSWNGGGGHSMAYQVVDGKAYILDCQTNTIYDEEDFANKYGDDVRWKDYWADTSHTRTTGPTYIRLDDLEIDDYASMPTGNDGHAQFDKRPNLYDQYFDGEEFTYAEGSRVFRAVKPNGGTWNESNRTLESKKRFDFFGLMDNGVKWEEVVSYELVDVEDPVHGRPQVMTAGGRSNDIVNGMYVPLTNRAPGKVSGRK